ncbi:MAG TPA: response regulator, partial [Vicinamibacterales bacterium]|nr:response regulator [Vicinamibacterales bacterium]
MPDTATFCTQNAVLVADDEPDIRELLAAYFSGRGHAVASARDGRTALAALERGPGPYGLVVTDLHMPGADGLAVLRAAKSA